MARWREFLRAQLSHSVSIIAIALPIFATPFVARPTLVAVLTVIAVPPVYSIRTTSGGPHAAMPDKVANNSPDNRTPNAPARSRISLTCEGNGGKAQDGRNEKQIFHG
jgi:predicted membrane metal-binding protein